MNATEIATLREAWAGILRRAEARYKRIGQQMRRYHLTGIPETDAIVRERIDRLGRNQVRASCEIFEAEQELKRLETLR